MMKLPLEIQEIVKRYVYYQKIKEVFIKAFARSDPERYYDMVNRLVETGFYAEARDRLSTDDMFGMICVMEESLYLAKYTYDPPTLKTKYREMIESYIGKEQFEEAESIQFLMSSLRHNDLPEKLCMNFNKI